MCIWRRPGSYRCGTPSANSRRLVVPLSSLSRRRLEELADRADEAENSSEIPESWLVSEQQDVSQYHDLAEPPISRYSASRRIPSMKVSFGRLGLGETNIAFVSAKPMLLSGHVAESEEVARWLIGELHGGDGSLALLPARAFSSRRRSWLADPLLPVH